LERRLRRLLARDFHQRMGYRAGRHAQLPDERIILALPLVVGCPAAHRIDQLTKLAKSGAGATHPIVQPGVLSLSVGDPRFQLAQVGIVGALQARVWPPTPSGISAPIRRLAIKRLKGPVTLAALQRSRAACACCFRAAEACTGAKTGPSSGAS
jgi:hypothetical protein